MNARQIGLGIGAMSIAFGLTDMALGPRFAKAMGMSEKRGGRLFRAVGAREVATGVVGLVWPASAIPVWTRLAADAGDLAVLGAVAARANPKRRMAVLGVAIVAGVALVDYFGARAIAQDAGA